MYAFRWRYTSRIGAGPTTTIFGNADQSFGTQVYAPDMKNYYAGFKGDGLYMVGWDNGTTVTLTGSLSGTYALGADQWVNVGSLASSTILNIASTKRVLVWTTVPTTNEENYSLLPAD
jgi:hypothetical protein